MIETEQERTMRYLRRSSHDDVVKAYSFVYNDPLFRTNETLGTRLQRLNVVLKAHGWTREEFDSVDPVRARSWVTWVELKDW